MEEDEREVYIVEFRPNDGSDPITLNFWSKEEKAREWCYKVDSKGQRPGMPFKPNGHLRVYRDEMNSPNFMPILLAIYTEEGKPIPKMYMDKFLKDAEVSKEPVKK